MGPDGLVQLTWKDGVAHRWSVDDLTPSGVFDYEGEGWGLTFDGEEFVQSDGSPTLTRRDATTFEPTATVEVTRGGDPVEEINELEWVDGVIWANVWHSDEILRIDPSTGHVTGVIDASALWEAPERTAELTLNGIAHRPGDPPNRLWLTGKNWRDVRGRGDGAMSKRRSRIVVVALALVGGRVRWHRLRVVTAASASRVRHRSWGARARAADGGLLRTAPLPGLRRDPARWPPHYPGEDVVDQEAEHQCFLLFEPNLGYPAAQMPDDVKVVYLQPTESSWNDQADRDVECLLIYDDDTTGDAVTESNDPATETTMGGDA